MRPAAEHVGRRLRLDGCIRWMAVGREHERIAPGPSRPADRQPAGAGHLIVDAGQKTLLSVLVRNREALTRQVRGDAEEGPGLAIVLVRREVVQLVLDDRTAERSAQ